MTAAELLAQLTRRGFRLDVCQDGISVEPASRLSDALIGAIREHKAELLVLLRAGASTEAQGKVRKRRIGKAQQRAAAPKAHAAPGADGGSPASKPEAIPERIPEQKPRKPPLCQTCWQRGHPNCTKCLLAYDSSLELGKDGVLHRVRVQTEQDRLPWRRCEVCHNPFQAPLFGSPNVCLDCRERQATR